MCIMLCLLVNASKCSSPDNFKLMPKHEHIEHHKQEQKDAKSYIDGDESSND